MLTAMEAYRVAREKAEGKVLIDASDFGTFYGFFFIRWETVGRLFGGGGYRTVDKETGKLGFYNYFMLLEKYGEDIFEKSVKLDVKDFDVPRGRCL